MKKTFLRLVAIVVCVMSVLLVTMPGAQAAGAVLRLGSTGSEVTALQNKLHGLGYLDYSGATGNYGELTRTAVIRFQSNNGLSADGVAGAATQARLYSGAAKGLVLRAGDSSEAVQTLQLKLKSLGYFPGIGTGHYGAVTLEAVKSFQRANKLGVDGIAGPLTRIRLFSGKASAPPAPAATPAAPSAAAMANIALAQTGKPYAWGGNGPKSYDCSGLVYYALTQAGYSVSRLSSSAYSAVSSWQKITGAGGLKKGDLLFFRSDTSAAIGHMGVSIGGKQFVHASSGQGQVMVSTLDNVYWARNYMFARRVG